MPNARCFLSHREQSLEALEELSDELHSTPLEPNGVGLLLASEHHRPQAERLRSTLAGNACISTLMGTITSAGVINERGYFDEPFLALLRWEPNGRYIPRALQVSRLGDNNFDDSVNAALMLSSTSTARAVLESAALHDIFTMGAVTFASEPTLQFHGDGSIIAGATGLGWLDVDAIATVLIPSAEELGPSLEVTAAHQDIVIELDGRPAVDVLCEIAKISDENEAFHSLGTEYLIGVEHDAHDYTQRIYRHIRALDPQRRMFSIDHDVQSGDRLIVGHRNATSAARLVDEYCGKLKARLSGRSIEALVFQGCIARGPALFASVDDEAERIRHQFPDIPLIGTYGNGEFFGQELQSYAAVLTAILG